MSRTHLYWEINLILFGQSSDVDLLHEMIGKRWLQAHVLLVALVDQSSDQIVRVKFDKVEDLFQAGFGGAVLGKPVENFIVVWPLLLGLIGSVAFEASEF